MKILTSILTTAPLAAFGAGTISLAALVCARAAAAPANTAPVTLAPMNVTADLWESPLERIPASVTVVGEERLREAAIKHFSDLVDQLPNFTWSGGTSRPRYFQIRGIGENSQYEGETPDSAVRFLVDDIDFTGVGTLATTFDVRQVEVLRGAQAGAFGANAAGGLVRLVTNEPTSVFTGRVESTIGSDSLRAVGLAFGGPLVPSAPDRLMARLSVQQHVSDGFRRNLTLRRDSNSRDETNARLRLTANPGAEWRWNASLVVSEVDNGFDEFALDNNGRWTFSDRPGRDWQRSRAGSLRGTYSGFQDFKVTTISSGSSVRSRYSYDDDWTAASYAGFSDLQRKRTGMAQELRLDSSVSTPIGLGADRWTLGAYFSRLDEETQYTNEDPANLRGLSTDYEAINYSLFAQAGWRIGERTRLIAGLRAEQLDVEGAGLRSRYRKTRGTFDPVASFQPGITDELVGGKLTIEHNLSVRNMLFASISRGYKAGGINVDARINPAVDPLTYSTETLWTYEAGIRGNWLEQRLTGEVTAFVLHRQDAQVRDSAGFGGSYRFFTSNANAARVRGIEASGSYTPVPGLAVYGSLGLLDSRLDWFSLPSGNVGAGRSLANTPRYGYNIGLRFGPAQGWFGLVEWTGRARQYDSNNHQEARSAFELVNASVGYSWRGWTFTLWARNLLDEVHEKRVFFFGNEEPDFVPRRYESRADPRQVGVTASYRF